MRLAPVFVVALAWGPAGLGTAAPEGATSSPTPAGGLRGYQTRLEAETVHILGAEVAGAMKEGLARRGTSLWACVSMREWERQVLVEAPTLARACQVLARRSEVLWTEERVSDAYASPMVQMASVHAMQRGMVRVLAQLGVQSTPPPAPPTPAPAATPPSVRPPSVAMNLSPTPPPHRGGAAPAPPPTPPAVRSPAELRSMEASLEREAFRILSPEVEGAVLAAVTARRAALRAAATVAQWKAALVAAHPALAKAGAVLERRAEVLHGEHRVLDAFASEATQRAAVRGLGAGLDRLLRQFGR